mmetsp:Transcript_31309/g.43565  ORF Transcript_31309/g.43565 Transcript_31309/m.43565 type:complete len:239 (+) Transcript_31309:137-853(+)
MPPPSLPSILSLTLFIVNYIGRGDASPNAVRRGPRISMQRRILATLLPQHVAIGNLWRVTETSRARNPERIVVGARPDGDGLGVRAMTAVGELMELRVNDWVQYHSNTYEKWIMARILDLNPDGTVKLDVKDAADLMRVRALLQVEPGDVVQYDSPTFGEWMDAQVREVLPNGLISLDIRDEADPSRIFVPLDVHPSMIRHKKEEGMLEGGGYIEKSEEDLIDFDPILEDSDVEELSG